MEYVKLNNGVMMPQLGLGTFKSNDAALCERTVSEAIAMGYRLIDTAQAYGNERYVGEAISKCGVDRKELFVVTKVNFKNYERTRESVEQSLRDLRVDYLDLVLLHWPFGNTYKAWRELEAMYDEHLIRAIGVSNYNADRLVDLVQYNRVVPAVNQVELNLHAQQQENRRWMQKLGVQPMGYAPLGQGRMNEVYNDPTLTTIAARYGKTPQQVALRYQLQLGVVIIPKTVNTARLKENIDLFDFALTADEMAVLAAMDTDSPMIGNPQRPELVERAFGW